ncbi:MAG: TldD/PmbA family protein [Thermoprotei archaeon]
MSELIETGKQLVKQALKLGYDEVAILINRRERSMIKLANSQPSVTQYWNDISYMLYLVKDKRIFIIEYKPEDTVVKPLEEILKIADKVEESPFYAPLPEPKPVKPIENLVDKKVIEYIRDPAELAEIALEAAHRKKIDYVAGTIDLWYNTRVLVTSKNVELSEDSTGVQMYLRAFSEPDGSGQWCTASTFIDKKAIEEAAEIAADYAIRSKNRQSIEPGRYDLVLSPLVFGNLMNLVARMSSAFSILMGMSIFMKNRPGDTVASEKLTLSDTPRDPELPGASSFDDEGVPTIDKPIIENGVLRTILHNIKTASKMGVESTGNAGWIYPRPWNLSIKPGDYSFEELVSEVKRGLLITNNWYTRLQNYVEGIFSTITRDALFLIENGEISKPVEKVRIADKIPKLLNNIEALGKDLYRVMWWEVRIPSKIPYVLVKDINISKHLL